MVVFAWLLLYLHPFLSLSAHFHLFILIILLSLLSSTLEQAWYQIPVIMPSKVDIEPIENILPPLIFGCATFNVQFNKDPYALDTTGLVKQALTLGVRAFDTSPYYGPSEELLSAALNSEEIRHTWPREKYYVLTKVGRVAGDEFDYSPEWVRYSVQRSLQRFKTSYLDVVYCHDVEFVSPDEAVQAVRELRRIRDEEHSIKYVGISGYPLEVLCRIAERVVRETGEPLDAVMSYGHFTLQNTTLVAAAERFRAAGVKVVPNASPLGMGLLRKTGPNTETSDWHPAPYPLRAAVQRASDFCEEHEENISVVGYRYSLENWLKAGSIVGTYGDPAPGATWKATQTIQELGGNKLGVSVMGVSTLAELTKTMAVWRSILDGAENGQKVADAEGRWRKAHEWSLNRRKAIELLAEGVKETLGEHYNYSWSSPPPDFVNARKHFGVDHNARAAQEEQQREQHGKQTNAKPAKKSVKESA